MGNFQKIVYVILVVYLGFRGYQIFFEDKPAPEPVVPTPASEQEQQENAELMRKALEALKE